MPTISHPTIVSQRIKRVRSKIHGTAVRPRLTVHRSNKHIYAQVINDVTGQSVAMVNDLSPKQPLTGTKMDKANQIAKQLADKLKKLNITYLAFDRGAYRYHGRVKAIAEAMRTAGIKV